MIFQLSLIVIFFSFISGFFENSTHIKDLGEEAILKTIIGHKYVIGIFYSSHCDHCRKAVPVLEVVAQVLEQLVPQLETVAINCQEHMPVVRLHNITALPTVKLFINRKPFEFQMFSEALPFLNWVMNSIGDDPVELTDVSTMHQILTADVFSCIGFFKNLSSEQYQIFKDVTSVNERLSRAIITKDEIFKEYKVVKDSHIIMFRQFDEPQIHFKGNFTFSDISDFIKTYSVPLLTMFYDKVTRQPDVFDRNIENYLIGFIDSTHKKFTLHKMLFTKAAKQFIGKVKFVYAKVDDHASHYLLTIFKMTKEEAPSYIFMRLSKDLQIATYRPSDPKMTSKRVVTFVSKVLNDSLQPSYRSEKLHQRWNKYPVKVLVADNFDEVTKDVNLTVFVQLCAEKCSLCNGERHILHSLAVSYRNRSDIWIGTIDLDKNDLKDLRVEVFPEYHIYLKDTNQHIRFVGNRSMDNYKKFIDSDGEINIENKYVEQIENEKRRVPEYAKSQLIPDEMSSEDLQLVLEEAKSFLN